MHIFIKSSGNYFKAEFDAFFIGQPPLTYLHYSKTDLELLALGKPVDGIMMEVKQDHYHMCQVKVKETLVKADKKFYVSQLSEIVMVK